MNLKDLLFNSQHSGAAGLADSPTDLISEILPNIYVFASLILLAYVVFVGMTILNAAGNPEQAQKGQQAVTNALFGFLIIFGSYWIIQIIQVITGIPILEANIL